MDMNKELNKINLEKITNLNYNVGNCFFDEIVYLLKYSTTWTTIWMNNMVHCKNVSCLEHKSFSVL
jgi:hypothetical protein